MNRQLLEKPVEAHQIKQRDGNYRLHYWQSWQVLYCLGFRFLFQIS